MAGDIRPILLILVSSLAVGLVSYLAILTDRSTFKQMKQVQLDCLHYMQNLRLSLPERYSYKDSRACPIEFFEYAHLNVHNDDPSAEIIEKMPNVSSLQSRASVVLTMNDTYNEFVNCSLKVYLIGSIYAAPRGSNKAVQTFPLMYRPQGVAVKRIKILSLNQTRVDMASEVSESDMRRVGNREEQAVRELTVNSFEMLQGFDYVVKMKRVSVEATCKGVPYEVEHEGFLMSLAIVRTDFAYPEYGAHQLELVIRWVSTIGVIVASLWTWLDRKRARTDQLGMMIVGVVTIASIGFSNPLWQGIKRSAVLQSKWSIICLEMFTYKLAISSLLVLNTAGMVFSSRLFQHTKTIVDGRRVTNNKRRIVTGLITVIGVAFLLLSFLGNMDLATSSGSQVQKESRFKLYLTFDKLSSLCGLAGGPIVVLYYVLLQAGYISSVPSAKSSSTISIYSILICLILDRFHWSSKQAKSIFTIQLAVIGLLSSLSILMSSTYFKKHTDSIDRVLPAEADEDSELKRLFEAPKLKKDS